MSGEPKRGMVAGKPIQTGDLSKEFDEGFERTFGKERGPRGRFVYRTDPGTGEVRSIPIEEAGPLETDKRLMVVTDLYMDGLRASDGTDIGNRQKRKGYMAAHGLADPQDFKEHIPKKEKEREAYFSGTYRDPGLKEQLGRAMHEHKSKRRK